MAPRKQNRCFQLCPVCIKSKASLPVHLRRLCMKNAAPDAISAAVEKAKRESQDLLATGRVFPYTLLCQIMDDADPLSRMIEELQHRHLVVRGIPPSLPNGNITAAESDERLDSMSVCDKKLVQINPDVQWKSESRRLMAKRGLYKKHSLDHPLLKDFGMYLEKNPCNENYKQEVINVGRFMYYMDPSVPSLEFVRDRERTKQYLCELSQAKLTKETQLKYLKSLKRFLIYHTVNTNLKHEDTTLYGECRHFIDYIGTLQKSCSKQVSKEITQKKRVAFGLIDDLLMDWNPLTPHDCWTVLRAARKDFLEVIGKVLQDKDTALETSECLLVLYYLEAVIILKHLQQPGVVEHMTVREWLTRKNGQMGHAVVAVSEHKMAAQQLAIFALSQEEEFWFDVYYTRVRPQLLTCKKRKREEVEDVERFFISTSGRSVYNPSNDLRRLHKKYKMKSINSRVARNVFEMASKVMSEADKALVAEYLMQTTTTAEKHHSMREAPTVVSARKLLATLAGDSSADPGEQGSSRAAHNAAWDTVGEPNRQMTIQQAFDELIQAHPVTLDGQVPNKAVRSRRSVELQRALLERWLSKQRSMRAQHVRSHFSRRQPRKERVTEWMSRRGWIANLPSFQHIMRGWKPSGSVDTIMASEEIQWCIMTQKWRGLVVCDTEEKGKGVLTTRRFKVGEVVCDYHGRIVKAAEGRKTHRSTNEAETGYMFFYRKSKGEAMCIDAHLDSCECHPDRTIYGRFINHSRKCSNLRPRVYTVDNDGKETDIILFIATRDIDVNEELLFDYGVRRNSFGAEGLDLHWL